MNPVPKIAANRVALAACLFFIVLGSRWAVINRFGTDIPVWDQWDAEGLVVLAPWLQHHLTAAAFFLPHNEHRVVLTKLLNFGLTVANGQWDQRLEAAVNAIIPGTIAVGFFIFGCRILERRWHAALFLLLAAAYALPLSWQNILGGFHSQQFLLIGLSFGAIAWLPLAAPWSRSWWLGAACATLALGTMASGLLAAAAVLGLLSLRLLRRRGQGGHVWNLDSTVQIPDMTPLTLRAAGPTLVLCAGLVAVGALTQVSVNYHEGLKARGAQDFFASIVHSLQWPASWTAWFAILMWLPWCWLTWLVLTKSQTSVLGAIRSTSQSNPDAPGSEVERVAPNALVRISEGNPEAAGFTGSKVERIAPNTLVRHSGGSSALGTTRSTFPAGYTLAGLGGWVLVQILATAYARGAGGGEPASRYIDTLVFGMVVNGIAFGWLCQQASTARGSRRVLAVLGAAWAVSFGAGAAYASHGVLRNDLPTEKTYYLFCEQNTRNYLATGDVAYVEHPEIPYPGTLSFLRRLTVPELRAILPVSLRDPIALAGAGDGSGFVRHDSRLKGLSATGASSAAGPLANSVTWGSYGVERASQGSVSAALRRDKRAAPPRTWESAPVRVSRPGWLRFEVAGQLGEAGVALELRDAASGALLGTVRPRGVPEDSWRPAYVRAPTGPFVVAARDESPKRWFAFSQPVEMATLSYWAWRAVKNGLLVAEAAAVAALALGLVAWRRQSP